MHNIGIKFMNKIQNPNRMDNCPKCNCLLITIKSRNLVLCPQCLWAIDLNEWIKSWDNSYNDQKNIVTYQVTSLYLVFFILICVYIIYWVVLGMGMGRRDYTTFGTKSDVGNNIDYTTLGVLNLEFSKKYRMSYNEKVLIVA